MSVIEIHLPDIGDFEDVEVVEILAQAGQPIAAEEVLLVIESDKASMDIPSPIAGVVKSLDVAVGDRIATGHLLAKVEASQDESSTTPAATPDVASDTELDPDAEPLRTQERRPAEAAPSPSPAPTKPTQPIGAAVPADAAAVPQATNAALDPNADHTAAVVVIGSGPGGYTAAFRAADLGLDTLLIERYDRLGGVCLNVGCIPSKALLHAAEVIEDAASFKAHGIDFGTPIIDIEKLGAFKNDVVGKLTQGLAGLAKQRKVRVLTGTATFDGPNRLRVAQGDTTVTVAFNHAIVAAGSSPVALPGVPEDPRIVDSTGALELTSVPKKMLVVGGGIIGLEMATVYAGLGAKVTVVELDEQLMPGCDPDLVKPLAARLQSRLDGIHLSTKVTQIQPQKRRVKVTFEGDGAPSSGLFDLVLVAIGRRPNGASLGLESAGVNVDERGFIPVDSQQRTNVPHIFAIGDIVGQPMLAHKATHEAKVAAEVIAGHKVAFEPLGIPSVAYTDPEIAWVGLTETQAAADGTAYEKAQFPWAASGRALGIDRAEGFTKLLFDKETGRIVGAGIVGRHAGDLLAEATLALELGADAEDIGLTIHAHPTLSETVNFAAEVATGTITDLYVPRRREKKKSE